MPTGPSTLVNAGTEDARTCAVLAEELAALVGASSAESIVRAKSALHQAIREFNADKTWQDMLSWYDIDLVADQDTYDLPPRWNSSFGVSWLLDTNDKRDYAVKYVPFDLFIRIVGDDSVGSSLPGVYTVDASRVFSGQLRLYPAPSAAIITSDPKFRIYYYADIKVCESDETIGVSATLESGIFDLALWRLNRMLGDESRDVLYREQALRSRKQARRYDNRQRLATGGLRGFY
jgi:hypothetical protein